MLDSIALKVVFRIPNAYSRRGGGVEPGNSTNDHNWSLHTHAQTHFHIHGQTYLHIHGQTHLHIHVHGQTHLETLTPVTFLL